MDIDPQQERKRIIAGRNRALALLLLGLVVLFFALTVVKMK
ncbi:MAG TPA: hypothetical protein PK680_12260 [Novosphingobium sp.]|nr:hypothetical protein [Novosphingobium sp.]